MSSWMNEAAVQNHNGNGFPHINDPNAPVTGIMDPSAFVANGQFGSPAAANQFANPQQMMALQNGALRNASPSSFPNPMYQTNSVIPSKRPRPREDGLAAGAASSPRPNAGMLPTSRADTPQQAHFPPSYPPGSHPPPPNNPPSFAHLPPNGTSNATPSPIMANHIRAGSVPQRVATTSPHPFSPASQSFAPQPSPVPSEASQPNAFGQSNAFPSNFNPNFAQQSSPGRPSPNPQSVNSPGMPQLGQMPQPMGQQMPQQMGPMSPMGQMGGQMQMGGVGPMGQMNPMSPAHQMNPMNPMGQLGHGTNPMITPQMQQQLAQARNPMEQQKLLYQMQVQRHLAQGNMQAASQAQAQAQAQAQNMSAQQRNVMARQQAVPPNGQAPPGTPGSMKPSQQNAPPLQQGAGRSNSDQFLSQLSLFMNRRNMPLDINPVVGDRPISLMLLFQTVQKFNGYRHVSQTNGWLQICHAIGLPAQSPAVVAQLKSVYERNLYKFEEFWAQTRAKATQQQQQQQQQPAPQAQQPPPPMQQPPYIQPQQPPQGPQDPVGTPKAGIPQQMLPSPMGGPGSGGQRGPSGPMPPSKQLPPNGRQPNMNGFATPTGPNRGQLRNGTPGSVMSTPTQDDFGAHSPLQSKSNILATPRAAHAEVPGATATTVVAQSSLMTDSDEYKPCSRESHTYGGLDVQAPGKIVADILRYRPDVPAPHELGNIDIHALIRSIQSGIHSEVRLALDTLAMISVTGLPGLDIELDRCEDLLDSLIDYAEELVEILAESSPEVSDEILIPPYEDTARACQGERLAIRSVPEPGSGEEELERAVEYLLCISVILRNLSFNPRNHVQLAEEPLIRFLCQMIRYVGTRNMLLRTHLSTLDFLKDGIVLLSNISGSVEISDRDEALCLLQFLLAFAPTPSPSLSHEHIFFPTFQPATQPYLPPAVDALAKLLARDEPNRTHFRNVFAVDTSSPVSSDLLTRTFSLAISPIPEHVREPRPQPLPPIVEARKPVLMQGLLAADIVASLVPGPESGVARAWLLADNGFAQNLHRSVRDLCHQYESVELQARAYRMPQPPRKDAELMYIVVLAISLLRKLSDKAVDAEDPKSTLPAGVWPSHEGLLEALGMVSGEWSRDGFLQNLVAFASTEG